VGKWKPWLVLRQREHIRMTIDPTLPVSTGGGLYVREDGDAWIVLAGWLSQREKRCVLTHELIHDELGSSCRCDGMPTMWDAVVARDESFIDREAAARLVPRHELAAFIRRHAATIEPSVTLADIAEHFDVTERYADLAFSAFVAAIDGWEEIVA
jgi:hypothetical protein